VDGGGDPADLVDTTGQFATILEYQIYPVVDIAVAAQALQQGVEFRDSLG
jgi:hypothetical protein